MDRQQKPIVQHTELCSMICASLDGSGVWGRMDTRICMAESLHRSPEAVTTLAIGYTPIQNVFGLKEKIKMKKKKLKKKTQHKQD